jgi:hypothetical protein
MAISSKAKMKIHPSGHHPEIFILALEEMAIGTGKHYKTFSSL